MNTAFNGLELKLLRQLNGLSLEELGQNLACTRQYIHKVETGQTIPSLNFIEQIANFFNVPDALFYTYKSVLQEEQIHFRSLRTTKVQSKQLVIARGEYLKRLIEYFECKLRLPKYDLESMDKGKSIEKIADQCRKDWQLGLGPITSVVRLCEAHGIVVTTFKSLSKEVDALSLATSRPIIVRNEFKESICRQRFDLAHELGHMILHDGVTTGDRITESEANHFASALLIPESMMRSNFPFCYKKGKFSWDELSKMKLNWKVSKAAILYRAKYLGLLDPNDYTNAIIRLRKNGEAIKENEDHLIPSENPELLKKCFEKLTKKGIYAEQIAQELNVNAEFLENLVGFNLQRDQVAA